jgi:hypothetical protein
MPYVTKVLDHVFEGPQHHDRCIARIERIIDEWGGRVVSTSVIQVPGDGLHMLIFCEKWVKKKS